jgi:hypothetical protein
MLLSRFLIVSRDFDCSVGVHVFVGVYSNNGYRNTGTRASDQKLKKIIEIIDEVISPATSTLTLVSGYEKLKSLRSIVAKPL